MRALAGVLPGVCLFLVLASPARATVFGTVDCVVHDPQHRPVAGASVTLSARGADWSRTAQTGPDGDITISTVPVGEYDLVIDRQGFEPARLTVSVVADTAPVIHVQLNVAAVAESVEVSASPERVAAGTMGPATLVNRGDIAGTPGASRTNSVSMITAFVPGATVSHDQLHVRGGHQVSWLVDGVPVPNTNIASNVGPQFDPKDADVLEARRGGYDAEFGDRTYAVFNVVPRSGFERNDDAELVVSAGSYGQTNDQVSVGGHSQRFAYYGSVSGNRSDLGLQPPTADILHDRQSGLGAFGTFFFNVDPNNQLRLVSSVRRDTYQVPNDAAAQSAGVDDVERESDAFVNLSWVRSFGSGALLTVSPFYHRNTTHYDGGAADVPVSTSDRRVSEYAGAQATFGATTGRHQWQVGFYGFHQQDDQLIGLVFGDESHANFARHDRPSGNVVAVFAQDTFRPTSWLSVTAGVRQTRFSADIAESATTPRGGVTVRIPRLGWELRGFYGQYYQSPPLMTVSGPMLDFVTSQNLAVVPLHGERDEEVQAGLLVPLDGWTIDADVFRTNATNFFDHNSVGNSNVFYPVTIDSARIRGAELAVRSPRVWKSVQVHLAYSHQVAEGLGGVNGGLIDFSPSERAFFLDHDQRHTLSAGLQAQLPHGAFAGATVYYGSGFPDAGGPARLPAHTSLDLVVGRAFGERFSLSVTALNVTNVRVLIDNSPTFGGTHYNHPREVYVEMRWRFRY